MKPLVLLLLIGVACNQSGNNSDADKNLGPADTIATINAISPKLDTGTAKNRPAAIDTTATKPAPDTSAKKPVAPVHESLQNYWALDAVDGKALDPKNFPGGTPYLQLSLARNTVSGYAGCNSMKGTMKVEGATINFGELATTKSTCSVQEFENTYVNSLSGHKVHYVLQPGRLILTTEQNKVFIYHKMQ